MHDTGRKRTTFSADQLRKRDVMRVPRLSGEEEDWATFSQTIKALVVINERLTEPQKPLKLLDSLEGHAMCQKHQMLAISRWHMGIVVLPV